jgi:hypothetical protein
MRESPDRAWVVGAGLSPQLPPRLATVFRFRSIDDYEPANTRRQAQYLQYLMRGPEGLEPGRFTFSGWLELIGTYVDPEALERRSRLLDLASVRWVLVPFELGMRPNFARWFRWAGLKPAGAHENLRLYENPRALPRAFVTYRFEEAPPTEALLERLARPDFDPLASSYVEGAEDWEVAAGAPARGTAATIALDDPERVEVEADLVAPGLLVLADTYYPGWRATLAGRELEIRPVNHLFRGVQLPAGRHRVRFEYRPQNVAAGATISAAALGIWGLLVWRGRRESV